MVGVWAVVAVRNGEVMSQSGIGQDFNVGEGSWTSAEVATMVSALEYAVGRQVTVVVASGDDGAIGNGSSTPVREVSIGAMRGVPDVAADASGTTGMALAFSVPGGGYELIGAGGTSAAAPFWAGLIALADQEAGHPLGFVNPAIYQIARGPQYHKAFHDITTGNNTVVLNGVTITGYQTGPGWDPVTGWGTPDAQVLIPLLAR